MFGKNVTQLQQLLTAALSWRNQGLALTPTPVNITQINSTIDGEIVILSWNVEKEDWDVTAP